MKVNRFTYYTWGVLAYIILSSIWGDFVRATGFGDGCGQHWPKCNGEIIPQTSNIETWVEFSHRFVSGVALLLVLGLLIWAFRAYPKKHLVRQGAVWAMIFIIIEALVGAGLVLFGWVADNLSPVRPISTSIHLLNTFFLLGSLVLTAWWASGGQKPQFKEYPKLARFLAIALFGGLLLGLTGVLTALADTLFPVESLIEGIKQDFSATAHFLIRVRVWHPIIAVVIGIYVVGLAGFLSQPRYGTSTKNLAGSLLIIFLVQLLIGTLNVLFLTPVVIQLIHLFVAQAIWLVLVLLSVSALSYKTDYVTIAEKIEPIHQV